MDETNSLADKAPAANKSLFRQPITQSNWDLLTRYGHLDNTQAPAAQGYQIVDEVRALSKGPKEHHHNPTVDDNGSEAGKNTRGAKEVYATADRATTVSRTTTASKASTASVDLPVRKPATTKSSSSGTKFAGKTFWNEEEVEELFRLRCRGLTYPAIAKKHLPGRELKAIQLKFAKLIKDSPYKERWGKYKGKEDKIIKDEDESEVYGDENDF